VILGIIKQKEVNPHRNLKISLLKPVLDNRKRRFNKTEGGKSP
jgi:hypothetical protein